MYEEHLSKCCSFYIVRECSYTACGPRPACVLQVVLGDPEQTRAFREFGFREAAWTERLPLFQGLREVFCRCFHGMAAIGEHRAVDDAFVVRIRLLLREALKRASHHNAKQERISLPSQ